MTDDDLDQAFPVPAGFISPDGSSWEPMPGMTLRDYFAGQVIIGREITENRQDADLLAGYAYALADALLRERHRR
jgi:hypothetical protein